MSLGNCATEHCEGTLCVSGDEVACMTCGQPVPDHPLAVQYREERARMKPEKPWKVQPVENGSTERDLLWSAVRKIERLESRVAALEAAAEANHQGQGRKREKGVSS